MSPTPPDRLLSRAEAAAFLGIPSKSLAEWSYRGSGPAYFRIGRYARYAVSDLNEWLESRRVEGRR